MRLAIFGATGGTGRCLVAQALEQGHEVVAFARNPASVGVAHERLRVLRGDALDPAQVAEAVAGREAVLCALGAPNEPGTAVLSGATRNILAAMEEAGVGRLVCETTAGLGDSRERVGFVFRRIIVPLTLKHVFADKEVQEDLIRRSKVDWVIVRPTRLTDGPQTGRYRVGTDLKLSASAAVSRADVADFMLRNVTGGEYVGKAPTISQ